MERVRNANGTRSERKWNAFGTRVLGFVRGDKIFKDECF